MEIKVNTTDTGVVVVPEGKLTVQTFFGTGKLENPAFLAAIGNFNAYYACGVLFLASAIVLIVSLFLGCRYSFPGKDDLSAANSFMDRAGDVADRVKAQF